MWWQKSCYVFAGIFLTCSRSGFIFSSKIKFLSAICVHYSGTHTHTQTHIRISSLLIKFSLLPLFCSNKLLSVFFYPNKWIFLLISEAFYVCMCVNLCRLYEHLSKYKFVLFMQRCLACFFSLRAAILSWMFFFLCNVCGEAQTTFCSITNKFFLADKIIKFSMKINFKFLLRKSIKINASDLINHKRSAKFNYRNSQENTNTLQESSFHTWN